MMGSFIVNLMKSARSYSLIILFLLLLAVRFYTGVYLDDSVEEVSKFWEPLHKKIYGVSLEEMTDTKNILMNYMVQKAAVVSRSLLEVYDSRKFVYLAIKFCFAVLSAANQTFVIYSIATKVDIWIAHLMGYLMFIIPGFYAASSSITYSALSSNLCMLALSVGLIRNKMFLVPLAYLLTILNSTELTILFVIIILLSWTLNRVLKPIFTFGLIVAYLHKTNEGFKNAIVDIFKSLTFSVKLYENTFTYVVSNLILNFNLMIVFLFIFFAISVFKDILQDKGKYINKIVYIPGITACLTIICTCLQANLFMDLVFIYPLIMYVISVCWVTLAKVFLLRFNKKLCTFVNILLAILVGIVCLSRIFMISTNSYKKEIFSNIPDHDLKITKVICYPRDWIDFPSHFMVPQGYQVDTLNTVTRYSREPDLYVTADKCDFIVRWDLRKKLNATTGKEEDVGLKNYLEVLDGFRKSYIFHLNGTKDFENNLFMIDYETSVMKQTQKLHDDYILDELDSSWELHFEKRVISVPFSAIFLRSFWIPGFTERKMQIYNYKVFRKSNIT